MSRTKLSPKQTTLMTGNSKDTSSQGSDPLIEKDSQGTSELKANFSSVKETSINTKPQSSPLLLSTPPIVSKALIRAYPYLLIVNKFLSIITWTNDDYWINILLLCGFSLIVLYFEQLVTWFGHLIIVGFITIYALLNNKILKEADLNPSLDEIVQTLTNTCIKCDRLLDPIISLSLTGYDIKRLLFTTIFLTPIYLVITFLMITPRVLLLCIGIWLLTYHSAYMTVTRKMIWKLKLSRILFFYLTGLDFLKRRNHSLFAAAFAKVQKNAGHTLNPLSSDNNRPVRFTYVIYENQRRWLGIGWTSNLLTYERTPWTDEFLNESPSIDSFKLPNPENDQQYSFGQEQSLQLSMNNARWRWVDKTWRLDLTNDGAITLPSGKRSKTTANPGSDEGFIYYDNTWKKASSEDSYSKYTRRRRWVRTAELIFDDSEEVHDDNSAMFKDNTKSIRFAEPEVEDSVIEEDISEVVDMNSVKESKQQTEDILESLADETDEEVEAQIEDIRPGNPIVDTEEKVKNELIINDKKNE